MRHLVLLAVLAGCAGGGQVDYAADLAIVVEELVHTYEAIVAEDPSAYPKAEEHLEMAQALVGALRASEDLSTTSSKLRALGPPLRLALARQGLSEAEIEARLAPVRVLIAILERRERAAQEAAAEPETEGVSIRVPSFLDPPQLTLHPNPAACPVPVVGVPSDHSPTQTLVRSPRMSLGGSLVPRSVSHLRSP